ncbi:MAG: DUF2267 domain-containing protein [Oleiphilaceae bacterium]|nr:DUF2267 domain-containing protein [Oleiphilaceae bacterium]
MQFHDFLGKVQHRAQFDNLEDALRATRATLNTLAERLNGNEPKDIASQLPGEIGQHLFPESPGKGERFDVDTFIARVGEREGVPLNQATHHAQVVMGTLNEAVSAGEMSDVRGQLPNDYDLLFQKVWAD